MELATPIPHPGGAACFLYAFSQNKIQIQIQIQILVSGEEGEEVSPYWSCPSTSLSPQCNECRVEDNQRIRYDGVVL
jgi:hypothetical protein